MYGVIVLRCRVLVARVCEIKCRERKYLGDKLDRTLSIAFTLCPPVRFLYLCYSITIILQLLYLRFLLHDQNLRYIFYCVYYIVLYISFAIIETRVTRLRAGLYNFPFYRRSSEVSSAS